MFNGIISNVSLEIIGKKVQKKSSPSARLGTLTHQNIIYAKNADKMFSIISDLISSHTFIRKLYPF